MRFPVSMAVVLVLAGPAFSQPTSFSACPHFFPTKPPVVSGFSRLRELSFDELAVLHSGQTKTPVYVAQRLNARRLDAAKDIQRRDRFYPEARLPPADRAQIEDYKRSGYSRGHMAAAADMSSEKAKAQSYSLANMVPQDPKHNGGAWSQIEQDTRRYIRRAKGDVFVFTGPVFDAAPPTIGAGQVHVPSAIFKVVYDARTGSSWVHWQNNSADTRVTPPISYAEFVRRTGLQFLPSTQ